MQKQGFLFKCRRVQQIPLAVWQWFENDLKWVEQLKWLQMYSIYLMPAKEVYSFVNLISILSAKNPWTLPMEKKKIL